MKFQVQSLAKNFEPYEIDVAMVGLTILYDKYDRNLIIRKNNGTWHLDVCDWKE